jgi:hypothetical protein
MVIPGSPSIRGEECIPPSTSGVPKPYRITVHDDSVCFCICLIWVLGNNAGLIPLFECDQYWHPTHSVGRGWSTRCGSGLWWYPPPSPRPTPPVRVPTPQGQHVASPEGLGLCSSLLHVGGLRVLSGHCRGFRRCRGLENFRALVLSAATYFALNL